MSDLDILIGKTQRNITYAYWGLFAAALAGLIFLPKPLDESTKALLITLLSVLGTLITMQNQFWFARPRAAGVPDPTTTTVTQRTDTVTMPSSSAGGSNVPTSPTPLPTVPATASSGMRDPEPRPEAADR